MEYVYAVSIAVRALNARFTIHSLIHSFTHSLSHSQPVFHSNHVLARWFTPFVRSPVRRFVFNRNCCFHCVIVTTLTLRVFILYSFYCYYTFTCVWVRQCVRLVESRVSALFCLVVFVVVVISVGFCFRYLNSLISSHSSHSLLCVRCSTPKIESNRATNHIHIYINIYAVRYMHDVSYTIILLHSTRPTLTRFAVR